MFKATEIISLTLNNPDEYFLGLKRVLINKNEKYSYIFNGVYTPKEQEIIEVLTKLCVEMEEVYTNFFHFEIKNDEVEKCITNKIKQFFVLINYTEDPSKIGKSSTINKDNDSNWKNNPFAKLKSSKTFINKPISSDENIGHVL